MAFVPRYFRKHPWQRRAATAVLALVAGVLLAVILQPYARDYLLLRDLASENPDVRAAAVQRAFKVANYSADTRRRLREALDSDNDNLFGAAGLVLRRLGMFNASHVQTVHLDRMRAIEIEQSQSSDGPVETRRSLLIEAILAGRDNRFVRRALRTARNDPAGQVRRLCAVLAACIADDASLKELLADKDPSVTGAAALGAGLAGRESLAGTIERLLSPEQDNVEVLSAAAYASARLRPRANSEKLCALLKTVTDEALRDRLLHVMTVLDDRRAREAVLAVCDARRRCGGLPPAAALLAASRLGIAAAGPHVRAVLSAATGKADPPGRCQLHAAIQAAMHLHLPVRAEADQICRKLWSAHWPLLSAAAARLLGRQARLDQGKRPDSPSRQHCIETLRLAVVYPASARTRPGQQHPQAAPLASAAAAVALWKLKPASSYIRREDRQPKREQALLTLRLSRNSSAFFIHVAAGLESSLAGDCIAWRLGRSGRKEAFQLGLTMLPALAAAAYLKVYNERERSAGAMLLALSARTRQQKALAVDRIRSRLIGGELGGEDNPFVKAAYRCALLILGQKDQQSIVRELLANESYPPRRALTALLACGDRQALDWLLWNPQFDIDELVFLLVDQGIGEVLSAAASGLATVDEAAEEDLLHWQIRILRYDYAVHRATTKVQIKP